MAAADVECGIDYGAFAVKFSMLKVGETRRDKADAAPGFLQLVELNADIIR